MTEREYLRHDLAATLDGSGDWFTCELFRLFMKADGGNQQKLATVYPDEYAVFREWKEG